MKIKSLYLYVLLVAGLTSCSYSEFEDSYTDPSKLSETTVGKQFSGMIYSNREFVLPSYWNYFVIHRITNNRYNQATGWVNVENQYVPGSAAVNDRWNSYYNVLAQYREIQKVYNALSAEQKADQRIYMITASTFFYDYTQQVIDLHGDIPWTEAGMLSTNGGDYSQSYPAYDNAEDIYTKMLDDLAAFADELNTITVKASVAAEFKTQDLINKGNVEKWKTYVNSLRLKMLTRVSGSSTFSARSNTEIGKILSSPGSYPVVIANAGNIQWDVYTLGTILPANTFQSGLEDWSGNLASKAIIDHMLGNADPRLTYVFEPGEEAEGVYMGLDPLMNGTDQNELVVSNTLTIYNRSTISRNQYFPGVIITASEVHLLAAEYYLKNNQGAMAKTHYETAIKQSLAFYQSLRSLSNNAISPDPIVPTNADIAAYLAKGPISWDAATTETAKLKLIAEQKWLHFNVIQPNENWAELRRLGLVELTFWADQSNQQSLPPTRWNLPGQEETYNQENYSVVQGDDKLTNKIFWDMN
ncbi:SusD/RagB family nutrient-binding outer membrane lipoprotein [Algoriphagus jejuensis]|uniref:SusD/RagB family nutrient-binding outer membrane lipoprotein n=1 Tax=Algoriphagus jejuensis TaxID=419934 RepID=A0ABP3YD57_9BACT